MIDLTIIKNIDSELFKYLELELNRQENNIELIASENFVSEAVLIAAGTHLTNKYAEGYPSKRYYGGCEFVDKIEDLAIERAKSLFDAKYVNVQPHSGSSANFEVFLALLKPGDTVLGMNLNHGGHLTHGSPVNFSGKLYNSVFYGVNDEGYIDYESVRKIAIELQPKMIIAGASAYPRTIDFAKFREIADEVGAYLLVDMAHVAGLVATKLHPNPLPYAHVVTTTTHKTLRGPRGGIILTNDETIGKLINQAVFPGAQGGPLMHIIAAKAIALLEASNENFYRYQKNVIENAQALAQSLLSEGIKVFTNGTDNHLILIDLRGTGVTGKELEHLLDLANITTNKNTIPHDDASPFNPNGLRIGTPSVTTRGMGINEMKKIGYFIAQIIKNKENVALVKNEVKELVLKFPLYKGAFKLV